MSEGKIKKPAVIERWGIPRHAEGVKCDCGGYADRVEPTHKEKLKYDWCGRYALSGWNCCAGAYKCNVCGARIVGGFKAPEME